MMPKTFSALICLCLLVTDVDAQVVVANRTIRGKSLISAADLALVASGTASLEAATLGTPHLVLYKIDAFSVWLAHQIVDLTRV